MKKEQSVTISFTVDGDIVDDIALVDRCELGANVVMRLLYHMAVQMERNEHTSTLAS